MSVSWWERIDQWRSRRRASRLRRLARFCRKVARNADRLADAYDPDDAEVTGEGRVIDALTTEQYYTLSAQTFEGDDDTIEGGSR